MTIVTALIKKEFRQNSVIFIFPFQALLILALAKAEQVLPVSQSWLQIISVVVPMALACSYGLQSFDLEENGQTRDFLLTRPLSAAAVIGAKSVSGLSVLLASAIAWPAALMPDQLKIPDFNDFSSFYFLAYLLAVYILYLTGLLAGIAIRGPIKLAAAISGGLVALGWFFYTWFQFLTVLYLQLLAFNSGPVIYLLLLLATCGLAALLSRFLFDLADWKLLNLSWLAVRSKLFRYGVAFLIIPATLPMITLTNPPVIRPFDSLLATFFGKEKWFIAVDGCKNPQNSGYLLSSGSGQLGVARPGGKPRVIYSAENNQIPLSATAWAPDGRSLLFKEDNLYRVGRIAGNRFVQSLTIPNAEFVCWGNDSRTLLYGFPARNSSTANKPRQFQLVRLRMGLKQAGELIGTLTSQAINYQWDSSRDRLLMLDPHWQLVILNITTHKADYFNLLNQSQNLPALIYSKITPVAANHYLITAFSPGSGHTYHLIVYSYDSVRNMVRFERILQKVAYKDFIPASKDSDTIVQSGIGTYYKVSESKVKRL